ncbi:MAG: hypothetical protein GOVbin2729_56 [Prokaryotic dsDNA virus sp.]|jgi:hypothetical protein|nr:MAG: hypothetical protein GOVbin2729_56 [Prokaryotic dsDNA virus sp.]|tara:strand:+ start:394 stop:609 length:216 start_codon:yes stop_codon:yes gene_type:complete
MTVEMLKVRTSDKGSLAKLYQAKICLTNAEGFLASEEVEQALGESLYYEVRKELQNLMKGIDVSLRIAEKR